MFGVSSTRNTFPKTPKLGNLQLYVFVIYRWKYKLHCSFMRRVVGNYINLKKSHIFWVNGYDYSCWHRLNRENSWIWFDNVQHGRGFQKSWNSACGKAVFRLISAENIIAIAHVCAKVEKRHRISLRLKIIDFENSIFTLLWEKIAHFLVMANMQFP